MKHLVESIQEKFPTFEDALINSINTNALLKNIKNEEVLIHTGQNIRSSVLVLTGLLKVYREDEDGNEFFMYYIQPGEACALTMICVMKQETSKLLVKGVADSEILLIPLMCMETWMAEYKTWYKFVIETYKARFEDLLLTVDQIAFRNMDERIEFYLKKHQHVLQSNLIPITHQEIANELNSSREVISRLMKKMAERGKIKIHRNNVELLF